MSDTYEKDDLFEALGYQRLSSEQANQPLKSNSESSRPRIEVARKNPRATPEVSPEVATPQRRIKNKLNMEEALIRTKPTTGCHECGGVLDSFTDRTPAGRTQLFRVCTGCGVVISQRLLRES